MALTPQNNEAFVREVDEELRRDQALHVWRTYGRAIIAGIVLVLAAFAGFLFWQHRQHQDAEREGETLQKAYDDLAAQDTKAAAAPLAQLAASKRDGYRVLAIFSQADVLLQNQDLRGAAAKFAAVAGDASVAQPFRDLALIRQTALEFETLKPQQVVDRLKPLAVEGAPWFGSAGELVAIAYAKMGKTDLAGPMFAALAKDSNVPQSIRSRARQMAGVMGIDAVEIPAEPTEG